MTTTRIVVAANAKLGRLRNGFPAVRMMKRTRVCVASDSTNQPVWKSGAEAWNTCNMMKKVKKMGGLAKPDYIQWAPSLPKTRSGKIMRRILRKIADNDLDNLGDVSTLADPNVVKDLMSQRMRS